MNEFTIRERWYINGSTSQVIVNVFVVNLVFKFNKCILNPMYTNRCYNAKRYMFFYQWVIKCIAMKEWSIAMSFKAGVWQDSLKEGHLAGLIEGG